MSWDDGFQKIFDDAWNKGIAKNRKQQAKLQKLKALAPSGDLGETLGAADKLVQAENGYTDPISGKMTLSPFGGNQLFQTAVQTPNRQGDDFSQIFNGAWDAAERKEQERQQKSGYRDMMFRDSDGLDVSTQHMVKRYDDPPSELTLFDEQENPGGSGTGENTLFGNKPPETDASASGFKQITPDPDILRAMNNDKNFWEDLKGVETQEGGYVNNPKDRGKETNFGISERRFPKMDIKNLTKEESEYLLYRDFYNIKGLNTLPDDIRFYAFKIGTHEGPEDTMKRIQRIVGTTVDGRVGPNTLKAIEEYGEERLLKDYKESVRNFYINNPDYKNFPGWMKNIE